jgi:hypothetical protein
MTILEKKRRKGEDEEDSKSSFWWQGVALSNCLPIVKEPFFSFEPSRDFIVGKFDTCPPKKIQTAIFKPSSHWKLLTLIDPVP